MGMNWLSFSKLQLASFQAKGNVLVQALSTRDVSVVESKSGQRERDEEDLFFRRRKKRSYTHHLDSTLVGT